MSELTVINVFLGSKMAPNGMKLAPYRNFGVLNTNPSSVSLLDFTLIEYAQPLRGHYHYRGILVKFQYFNTTDDDAICSVKVLKFKKAAAPHHVNRFRQIFHQRVPYG